MCGNWNVKSWKGGRISRRESSRQKSGYVIQGMYRSERHMIEKLTALNEKLGLSWLKQAISGLAGRENAPTLYGRAASARVVVSVAPQRPQTDLCTFCDYWDKVYGGCLIKRLNGEACPYTGRRWNFSLHIAPEVETVCAAER